MESGRDRMSLPAYCEGCGHRGTNIENPKKPRKVCSVCRPGSEYIEDCPCGVCLVRVMCQTTDNCILFEKAQYYNWKPVIDVCRPDHKSFQEKEWDKEL